MATGHVMKQLAILAAHSSTHDPCQFMCEDDKCLPNLTLLCDGHLDCRDGIDEADCPLSPTTTPVGHTLTATDHLSAAQIFFIVISVLLAVVIIICVVSHYKMGARSWSDLRNRPQPTTRQQHPPPCSQHQYAYTLAPSAAASIMYTPATIQERQRLEVEAHQDHQVQLHSVQTDLALDLPHSIPLPDGEELPYGSTKNLKLRDSEQQSEITRSFIRPPPNRTVPEGDSLPPFRSNSVSLLQKPTTPPLAQLLDSAPLVMRSHSMSSSSAQSSRLSFPRGQFTQISNPNISAHLWIPSLVACRAAAAPPVDSTTDSVATSESNRTCGFSKPETDSKYDSTGPPPPYSEVVNQWDVNTASRQQNSGV